MDPQTEVIFLSSPNRRRPTDAESDATGRCPPSPNAMRRCSTSPDAKADTLDLARLLPTPRDLAGHRRMPNDAPDLALRRHPGLSFNLMASREAIDSQSIVSFMELALEQARFALDNLEVPVGCVIVEDNKVIASGSNRTTETRNATRHAEMEAIDFLLDKWQRAGLKQSQVAENFSRCDLYVTCEPCIMCATTLSILGIRELYYGCANDKFGGCGSILPLHETDTRNMSSKGLIEGKGFKCTGGLMSAEAIALFRCFYEQGNPNAPKPHRPVRVSHND